MFYSSGPRIVSNGALCLCFRKRCSGEIENKVDFLSLLWATTSLLCAACHLDGAGGPQRNDVGEWDLPPGFAACKVTLGELVTSSLSF